MLGTRGRSGIRAWVTHITRLAWMSPMAGQDVHFKCARPLANDGHDDYC